MKVNEDKTTRENLDASLRPAQVEDEWPQRVDCDCCGQPMEFIGLSLYACKLCQSNCDGDHAIQLASEQVGTSPTE